MNRYAAQAAVNRKIYELKLEDMVWTSLICGGMVMKIYFEDNHWDAMPEDFAEAFEGVTDSGQFFAKLETFPKNLM